MPGKHVLETLIHPPTVLVLFLYLWFLTNSWTQPPTKCDIPHFLDPSLDTKKIYGFLCKTIMELQLNYIYNAIIHRVSNWHMKPVNDNYLTGCFSGNPWVLPFTDIEIISDVMFGWFLPPPPPINIIWPFGLIQSWERNFREFKGWPKTHFYGRSHLRKARKNLFYQMFTTKVAALAPHK